MFERNDNTGVSLAMQRAPDAPYGGWTDLGGNIIDSPATVLDPAGAVVLFGIGANGLVYTRRQTAAGANSPFSAWQPIG